MSNCDCHNQKTGSSTSPRTTQSHSSRFDRLARNAFFEFNIHGQMLYVDHSWEKLTGQAPEDALGAGWRTLVSEATANDLNATFLRLEPGEIIEGLRFPSTTPMGEQRWLQVDAKLDGDSSNEVLNFKGNLMEVTNEVNSEARSSQLIKILDATSDFFILEELETGVIRYANDPGIYQLGIRPTHEGGQATFLDRLSQSSQGTWKEEATDSITQSRIWTGELILEPTPGLEIWVNVTCIGHKDEHTGTELVSILAKDITAQKRAEGRLEHAATHDGLTGLANRTKFFNSLESSLRDANFAGQRVAVMYCDLDSFKEINDTLGHDAGDAVLNAVSDRLRSSIRDHDVVARFGGDEFVILCTALPQEASLKELTERLITSVARPIDTGSKSVEVGISIGVAYSTPNDSLDAIVTRADEALYIAKEQGKNQAYIASASDSNRAVK